MKCDSVWMFVSFSIYEVVEIKIMENQKNIAYLKQQYSVFNDVTELSEHKTNRFFK